MSGEWLHADEALRLGYLSAIVTPGDLIDAARREALRYTDSPPQALAATKRLLYDGLWRSISDHQASSRHELLRCFASEEHRAGVAAFLDRHTDAGLATPTS